MVTILDSYDIISYVRYYVKSTPLVIGLRLTRFVFISLPHKPSVLSLQVRIFVKIHTVLYTQVYSISSYRVFHSEVMAKRK